MKTASIGLAFLGALISPAFAMSAPPTDKCVHGDLTGVEAMLTKDGLTDQLVLRDTAAATFLTNAVGMGIPMPEGITTILMYKVFEKANDPTLSTDTMGVAIFDKDECSFGGQVLPVDLVEMLLEAPEHPSGTKLQNGHVSKFDYDPKAKRDLKFFSPE
jgi:hypothetical protein